MQTSERHSLLRWSKYLSIATTVLTFVLIVLTGILRASGSSAGCSDWLNCSTGITLSGINSTTVVSLLTAIIVAGGIFFIVDIYVAFVLYRFRHPAWFYYVSVLIYFVKIIPGTLVSTIGNKEIISRITTGDQGLLFIVLSLMTIATTYILLNGNGRFRFSLLSRYSLLSIVALIFIIGIFVSGSIVNLSGIASTCTNWPLCENIINPASLFDWINLFHRVFVLSAGIILLYLMLFAWKHHKSDSVILVMTSSAVVLFFSQALLAAQMVDGFPIYLLVIHQSTAVAVWIPLLVHITYVSRSDFPKTYDDRSVNSPNEFSISKVKDLFMLTKPVVVALLLVTTYAGMVIAGEKLPSAQLAFWTLTGGLMAAGGSGAINQYIDRFDDIKMQRTMKRPIPSGRLTPAEGLAFGITMTLGSFYVMVAFVNLPAALLTLAGIIYYIPLYSVILKKTTVQNIVIGGGAGAIPPLVGWSAVTGGLNIPSLFLFAVVFLWTPPHFWALALVRRKDYARASVPMLPVIRGVKETRRQIFVYSIELVGLTLLLPIFGLGGSIYLIGAAILGLWLLSTAWKVWKKGGNRTAWKMYRYSSMYLAFLFMALMIDALL